MCNSQVNEENLAYQARLAIKENRASEAFAYARAATDLHYSRFRKMRVPPCHGGSRGPGVNYHKIEMFIWIGDLLGN